MDIQQIVEQAWISPDVLAAHSDYVAVIIGATDLVPGEPTDHSEALLKQAEVETSQLLDGREPQALAEIQAWREAYLSFGVKPREGRSSVEALVRRIGAGLPRIDRLTDVYNAMSVLHLTPLGGEDLRGYQGPARLVIADGTETFDTVADGEPVTHLASAGEIVWRDDVGVTCRRWNWRQCVRTRLSQETTEALFIIDALGPDSRTRAEAAATALIENLIVDSPGARFSRRTIPD